MVDTSSSAKGARAGVADNWLLRNWYILGAAAVVFAGLAGLSSILVALRAADADAWVTHTFEVRETAGTVMSNLQDAEIGQRGYLLRNDEHYLEPYERAVTAIPAALTRLQALVVDNAGQTASAREIGTLVGEKLGELGQTVALAKQGKREEALAILSSDRGIVTMDHIRSQLADFAAAERELLSERQATVQRLRSFLIFFIVGNLIAAVLLAAVLGRAASQAIAGLRARTRELETEAELRRQAEETLRQSQKMEAVGQLAGGIAHDFNNALTIVIGSLDMMRRRLTSAPPEQPVGPLVPSLLRPLDNAVIGGKNAAQLTQRLLAFSRRQALRPERTDLNRYIADISELLRRTLGEDIRIETVLAGGLWPTLVDVNQLENALVNLAINARDAMPDGGRLTIETANAALDEAYARRFGDVAAGQYAVLSVSDTGHGIAPEDMQRVFEPFFTTKAVGKGSGLGLAMIHGFVKQSNGHVRIYSEVGKGTTVKIYLPRLVGEDGIAATSAPSEAADGEVPRATRAERVLVVEDNDGVRAHAVAALEELGYRVIAAATGDDALKLLREQSEIELLFTDVVLPGDLNGRQLADRVAQDFPRMKIFFTTGYTRNAIVHGGVLDANVHLLSKPYTQQELGRKVRELLD